MNNPIISVSYPGNSKKIMILPVLYPLGVLRGDLSDIINKYRLKMKKKICNAIVVVNTFPFQKHHAIHTFKIPLAMSGPAINLRARQVNLSLIACSC